jgi:hypothetical protein
LGGFSGAPFETPYLARAADAFDRTARLAGNLSLLGPFRREKFALCAAGEVRS